MCNLLDRTREEMRNALTQSTKPVVCCSFGKDSVLLLALAREVRPDINIVHFGQDRISPNAERLTQEWGIDYETRAPADYYLLPWGNNSVVLASEYLIEGRTIPVWRDVELSDHCDFENLSPRSTLPTAWPFDLTLWGFKSADRANQREVGISMPFARDAALGPTRLFCPLYDWTDAQVLSAISDLGIPFQPGSDSLSICARCLGRPTKRERDAALAAFCRRFGYTREVSAQN